MDELKHQLIQTIHHIYEVQDEDLSIHDQLFDLLSLDWEIVEEPEEDLDNVVFASSNFWFLKEPDTDRAFHNLEQIERLARLYNERVEVYPDDQTEVVLLYGQTFWDILNGNNINELGLTDQQKRAVFIDAPIWMKEHILDQS